LEGRHRKMDRFWKQQVAFQQNKTVQSGKTYKLTADVTINGIALATASVTGPCP